MAGSSSQPGGSSLWELSLYDQHRKPQEMVADSSLIGVAPRALHAELMCPICLDLMSNTQTTKECLHRFCQECIITALRSGNKECPTCRKKLISKRSLRPDPNYDALIAKIYPERELLNEQQEKGTARRLILHQRKRKASPLNDEEEIPADKKTRDESPVESEPLTPPSSHNESIDSSENGEVELQLRPHPASGSNAIRNLVTSPACTVSHLTKYLSLDKILDGKTPRKNKGNAKSGPATQGQYCIYVDDDGSYSQLSKTTSLKQVIDNHWTPGEKLKLYFNRDIES